MSDSILCGIDLGTTYSSISWFDELNNRVQTISLESADGNTILRSVVYFPEDGHPPVVGDTAWNMARYHPDRVIVGIKREMGTAFKTAPIDGKEYMPEEISAEILKTLVRDASMVLGTEVRDVVITVPAYFGQPERTATEEAGKLAGLNVLSLLPEPHAAALAFAVDKITQIQDRHVLVYDLGGGTFDVTLIHATTAVDAGNSVNLDIKTLCKQGYMRLGGLDWDKDLAEIVIEKVRDHYDVEIAPDDPVLLDNCEKGKRLLTRTPKVSIVADQAGHQVDVTVSEFESRTRDHLYQTEALLAQVLEEAERDHGISRGDVEILLAGGSSRMPMVANMIQGLTGKPPLRHGNPELAVTIGAAYWAYVLSGKTIPVVVRDPDSGQAVQKDVRLQGITDTAPYAIGIQVVRPNDQGELVLRNAVILPTNIPYGEQRQKDFRTTEDGMTEIPIILYKGDSADPDECRPLVTFTITGLPANRPKGQLVRVLLGYDNSGILRGSAVDLATNTMCEIVIENILE